MSIPIVKLVKDYTDMNNLDTFIVETSATEESANKSIRHYVQQALENYFSHLDGHTPVNLYEMVLEEIEIPLLEAVMRHTKNNQSKAAKVLGLSRGTLRKKIKQYDV